MAHARHYLLAAAAAGALVATTGATGAQADAPPAPRYEPQMIEALADTLGVSDSAAVRHLDEQADQQRRLNRLRQDGVRTDGAFFDAKGTLTVNVGAAREAKKVKATGLTARIPGRGEAELTRITAALDTAAAKRVPSGVASWEADLASDTVKVTVTDSATPAARAFLKKARGYGDAVRIVKSDRELQAKAAVAPGSRMNINNNPGSWCSVGFGAKNSAGRQYLVTAGHCVTGNPGLYFDGSKFASGSTTRFVLGRDSVDMGLATVDAGSSITTSVGTWGNGASVAVRGSQRAAVGASLCKSGSTTGWTCGKVNAYDVTVTYTDRNGGPDTVVTGLGRSTVCVEGGDSGGAYIAGNQAQGMTSGGPTDQSCGGVNDQGSSYFQPLDDTLRHYGLTLNTN
ncbi:S1 family peptidase [Streptomyces flavofungini]|uniref:S1 family peptidase n=1 Tax=Streptomyces flavofungini TaxID=68200 RepID=A0ABS0XH10_9ACTN|nr:S1 family peptidase [Streptomyces flavofungini]MBJ3812512.1 S1 family peptidase [Streptomyces flavofungini]GHC88749.1 serine protease [Streptomyces flavofungini]